MSRHHSTAIHLLLTDLIMPEMGGPELVERFISLHPGVPVLCMSGYSDRVWPDLATVQNYIQKPFTLATLLTQVKALLDRV